MMKMPDFATSKLVDISKPEEKVRQEYEQVLVEGYAYSKEQLDIEVKIPRGSGFYPDKADIVIYHTKKGRDPAKDVFGIVETKRKDRKTGVDQIKSYMTATSAEWGVWTNGQAIEYFCKPPGQSSILDDVLNNIPSKGQSIEDVGKLRKQDLKPYGRLELKLAFRRILNTLYANTNISRREKLGNETIKLIFAKIRDETTFPNQPPAFRVGYREKPEEVKARVVELFASVIAELADDGVFEKHDTITLDAKGVAWVVGQLERGSLVETPTDVVGDAFEVFAESKFVGEKGEFFTPRGIIEIAVKLVDPQPKELICDPACGSGGFLIATMRHMWKMMETRAEWRGLRGQRLQKAKEDMAARCFFGIDKETDLVRIAKAYMAICGDGRSNIIHENSLHAAQEFNPLATQKFVVDANFRQFDCILTNPPYGTKAKVLADEAGHFALGHKWKYDKKHKAWKKGKASKTDPYVLFIERCFEMLKDGGGG